MCVLLGLVPHCDLGRGGQAGEDHVTRVRLNPGAYTFLRGHAGVLMWLLCPLPNIQTHTHTHMHTDVNLKCAHRQKHLRTVTL